MVGATSAALASVGAALCCIGPLALTLLGVNGMILAASIKPYRFYLLGVSALMLGVAFWLAYRPRRFGAHCPARALTFRKAVLWGTAALWMGSLVLQFVYDKIIV